MRTGRTRVRLSWATLSEIVTAGAVCRYCGSREDLVAHHKVPRRLGGLDVLENLEPVCRSCHPGVEQEALKQAEPDWERPVLDENAGRPQHRHRLMRPY